MDLFPQSIFVAIETDGNNLLSAVLFLSVLLVNFYIYPIFTWDIYFIWLLYICPLQTFCTENFYFNLAVVLSWIEELKLVLIKASQFIIETWIAKLSQFHESFIFDLTTWQIDVDIQTCTLLCMKTVITK